VLPLNGDCGDADGAAAAEPAVQPSRFLRKRALSPPPPAAAANQGAAVAAAYVNGQTPRTDSAWCPAEACSPGKAAREAIGSGDAGGGDDESGCGSDRGGVRSRSELVLS
jgi:hypothetical protein